MKRPFFKKITSNVDCKFKNIVDIRNIAEYEGIYVCGIVDNVGYKWRYTDDFTQADSLYAGSGGGPYGFPMHFVSRKFYVSSSVTGIHTLILASALFNYRFPSGIYGDCIGGSITFYPANLADIVTSSLNVDILTQPASIGVNSLVYWLFVGNTGSATQFRFWDWTLDGGIIAIRTIVLDAANQQRERVVPGWWDRDNNEYHFLYAPSTTWKEYKINLTTYTLTDIQDMTDFAIPSTYEPERSIFWKKGNVYFFMNPYNLYWYDFKNSKWTHYIAISNTKICCVFWDKDYLLDNIIGGLVWDSAIWEIIDTGILKKKQIFEPRDYKKVYLTNSNESLLGVVQFQNANANDDISLFVNDFNSIEVLDEFVGHIYPLKCSNTSANQFFKRVLTTATSKNLEIWVYRKETNLNSQINLTDSSGNVIITIDLQTDGKIDLIGATSSADIIDYEIGWQRFRIEAVKNGATIVYYQNSLLGSVTGGNYDIEEIRGVHVSTNITVYYDSIGDEDDNYVEASNRKITAFCGYGKDIGDAWFSTGNDETGIFQLDFQDYTEGTQKALLTYEMFKTTRFSLTRTNPSFDDESIDLYNELFQLCISAKVNETKGDGRFYYEYQMIAWEFDDFNPKNKITVKLLQYSHAEMLKFILDTLGIQLKYGPGTNALVNEFTESQIDGTDDDWTNNDGTSCVSSYISKKAFLNGFIYNLIQQFDNSGVALALCYVRHDFTVKTVFSGKICSSDVTNRGYIRFYDSGNEIGRIYFKDDFLRWYSGSENNLVAAVDNTIYHWAIVCNVLVNTVDIYVNGTYINTIATINNFTDAGITYFTYETHVATTGYYLYQSETYKGNSIFEALNTFCSISPLLTTKHDFDLKDQTIGKTMKLIDEETGFVVSHRPNGLVYVDQFSPNGIIINADENQGVSFLSLLNDKTQKFSLVTAYGGYADGKPIISQITGEPNYGTYEIWFPSINGREPGDLYYDSDGNPKSHRLDDLVAEVITKRNIKYKSQTVGKRSIGLIQVGTYSTYTNSRHKINAETWYAWRKITYNLMLDDNRAELANSYYTPSDGDSYNTPQEQLIQAIDINGENIVNNQQNIGAIQEDINSFDGQGQYPAHSKIDSDRNYGTNKNVNNFDSALTGWSGFAHASSVKLYNSEKYDYKHVLELMAGDTSENFDYPITEITGAIYVSMNMRADVINKDHIFYINNSSTGNKAGFRMASGGNWLVWRNGGWVALQNDPGLSAGEYYHLVAYYDDVDVKYWINHQLVYENTTTDTGTSNQIRINDTSNNDGNRIWITTFYAGTSKADAFSSLWDGTLIVKGGIFDGIPNPWEGVISYADADDVTPNIENLTILITSANTGATVITNLDNAKIGQEITIIGGSNTNSSTIADGGNFNLSGAWTASLDDTLTLICIGNNSFIEKCRSNN